MCHDRACLDYGFWDEISITFPTTQFSKKPSEIWPSSSLSHSSAVFLVIRIITYSFVPVISAFSSATFLTSPSELQSYGASGIVNSAHHQAVKKPGKGFKIGQVWFSRILSKGEKEEWMRKIENEEKVEVECKRSCIIEGMVHKELPIIAVQWHPELMRAEVPWTSTWARVRE